MKKEKKQAAGRDQDNGRNGRRASNEADGRKTGKTATGKETADIAGKKGEDPRQHLN